MNPCSEILIATPEVCWAMYHEKKVINGILHWRNSPNGEWNQYDQKALTNIIQLLENQLTAMRDDPNISAYYKAVARSIRE